MNINNNNNLNTRLNSARANKNDDFYTQLTDIEKEQSIIDGTQSLIKKYYTKIKEKIDNIWVS